MENLQGKKRGRPATGRNTKVIRVPVDFDVAYALHMQYDILPLLEHIRDHRELHKSSPRFDQLLKLIDRIEFPVPKTEE